jgi:hypothetical protein
MDENEARVNHHNDDPVWRALDRANQQLGKDIATVMERTFDRLGFDYRPSEVRTVIAEELRRMVPPRAGT